MNASKQEKRQRGRPPRISRQKIVDAVLQDPGDLTLLSVANKLGTTPQALYHYFAGQSELMEVVFRKLLKHRDATDFAGRTWTESAIALGLTMQKVYGAVPGLADYAVRTPFKERALYERWERLQEIGVAEGFDPLKAFWATRAISEFVHGWYSREHRRSLGRKEGEADEFEIFEELAAKPGPAMPLTENGFEAERPSAQDRFEFTLAALVHGLAAAARTPSG